LSSPVREVGLTNCLSPGFSLRYGDPCALACLKQTHPELIIRCKNAHGLWQPCKTLDKSVLAVLPIRRAVGRRLRKLGALASVGFHGADKIPHSFHNVTKNCLSLGPTLEIVLSRYTQPEREVCLLLEHLKLTLPKQAPPKIYSPDKDSNLKNV
jgi:hypothetical protein